jgi:hypothetical protein
MNVADRPRLYREARRIVRRGGRLAVYDVVSGGGEPLFPLPWASTPEASFLLSADETRGAIEEAGFRTLAWQDETEVAKAWILQMRAAPPLSPNMGVVMGPGFTELVTNFGRSLMEGRVGVLTALFEAV